jgi:hypothetical protein
MGLFTKIHIVLILAVGAFAFWLVNRLVEPRRVEWLLKLLIVLLCAVAILQRTVLLSF